MYEHGKTTPSSVSRSNGTTENITVKDKDDSHTCVTKGVTKALRTDFNDAFGFETLTEEDNLDKWFLEAESDLPGKEEISMVKEFEDTFNFKIMSEKDNLNDWILSAEISSFRDKTEKNLMKLGDKSTLFHDFFREIEIREGCKEQFHEFFRKWNFRLSSII